MQSTNMKQILSLNISLAKNPDFIKAQASLKAFTISFKVDECSVTFSSAKDPARKYETRSKFHEDPTRKDEAKKSVKQKGNELSSLETRRRLKKINQAIRLIFKSELDHSQDKDAKDQNSQLSKSLSKKLSKMNKRRDLENHKNRLRPSSLADGLFEIFFPEVFVLEAKQKQARHQIGKNPRMISRDLKILAKGLVKFSALSVKSCKTITKPISCVNKPSLSHSGKF